MKLTQHPDCVISPTVKTPNDIRSEPQLTSNSIILNSLTARHTDRKTHTDSNTLADEAPSDKQWRIAAVIIAKQIIRQTRNSPLNSDAVH
ncbi:MAG: hypothetical protein WCK86_11280 [Planctomycetia bacterium]